MTPAQIRTYFRELIDEPVETFVSSANLSTYLDIAYSQFRQEVSNIDPLIYATILEFSASGKEIDLTAAPSQIMGATVASGPRLMQLIGLEAVDGAGHATYRFEPVSNLSALMYAPQAYMLRGSKIVFNVSVSDTVRLTYLGEHTVTWTSSSWTTYDNLSMFHDVIALLAYDQYAMRDGLENPVVFRQLNQRIMALREYLQSRNLEGSSYVARVGWDESGWQ